MKCHNPKCSKGLIGNFVVMNYGGLLKNGHGAMASPNIEALLSVSTHSNHGPSNSKSPTGDVCLHSEAQHNYGGQGESYFCSKKCLVTWFESQLKDLPDPGKEEYRP